MAPCCTRSRRLQAKSFLDRIFQGQFLLRQPPQATQIKHAIDGNTELKGIIFSIRRLPANGLLIHGRDNEYTTSTCYG